ncbi:MAG: hypothetical protein RBQ91_02305 [Acholeplasma sp.]|nr:hypothetical protein [Acholeplasma sp.]
MHYLLIFLIFAFARINFILEEAFLEDSPLLTLNVGTMSSRFIGYCAIVCFISAIYLFTAFFPTKDKIK